MSNFAEPETAVEYARSQWDEGESRMDRYSHDSKRRQLLEDVVEGIVAELERRIGQTFMSIELVRVFESAEPWCMGIAHETAPEQPFAWNMDVVQAAAFNRFARRAQDYQP